MCWNIVDSLFLWCYRTSMKVHLGLMPETWHTGYWLSRSLGEPLKMKDHRLAVSSSGVREIAGV